MNFQKGDKIKFIGPENEWSKKDGLIINDDYEVSEDSTFRFLVKLKGKEFLHMTKYFEKKRDIFKNMIKMDQ